MEVGLDFEPEAGLADNGDLEADLPDLFEAVGAAAREAQSCIALFVDELQYVSVDQLAALITALHRVAQRQTPVVMVGAGLPQIRGRLGKAKSYAERLFEFHEVGALSHQDARIAISKPAREEGVVISDDALDAVVEETQCYPYFLQEWGYHAWNAAPASPISEDDVEAATPGVVDKLDRDFFRVRYDRLTPKESEYLRAMTELGPGPHRSGDIADKLGVKVTSVAPRRSALIAKGMIYSPAHGDTAFTVPLFDQFMQRALPRI